MCSAPSSTVLLIAALVFGAGAVATPKVQSDFSKFGSTTPQDLSTYDRAAAKFGVDGKFERDVTYLTRTLSGKVAGTEGDGLFAVLDYRRPSDLADLERGVEIWVRRDTGQFVVIPKSYIRSAAIFAAKQGMDLTRFDRCVEQDGDRFMVSFSRRPPKPGITVFDGSFTVVVDAKTGRASGLSR